MCSTLVACCRTIISSSIIMISYRNMCCSLSGCFFQDFLSRILIHLSLCMLHSINLNTGLCKEQSFIPTVTTLNCLIGIAARVSVQWGAALSRRVSPFWCVMGSCGRTWDRPNPVGARPCCEPLHGLWHGVLARQTQASLQVMIHKIQEVRNSQDKVKAPVSSSSGTTCS